MVCIKCEVVVEESPLEATVEFTVGGAAIGQVFNENGTALGGVHGIKLQKSRADQTNNELNRQLAVLGFLMDPDVAEIKGRARRALNLMATARLFENKPLSRCCAVTLYAALRQQRRGVLLIEFTEYLCISVYCLGAFWSVFREQYPMVAGVDGSKDVSTNDPSLYVARFAAKLEFGDQTRAIIKDALVLVKRMGEDWLSVGRRPAGIAAAALAMAARLHGIERSLREVVLVVKLSEKTVLERLEEFQNSPAGQWTAEDLREWAYAAVPADADAGVTGLPPSFVLSRIRDDPTILESVCRMSQQILDASQLMPEHATLGSSSSDAVATAASASAPASGAAARKPKSATRKKHKRAAQNKTKSAAPKKKRTTPEQHLAITAHLTGRLEDERDERERNYPAGASKDFDSDLSSMLVDIPPLTPSTTSVKSLTQLREEKDAAEAVEEEEEGTGAGGADKENGNEDWARAAKGKGNGKGKRMYEDPDRGRVILTEADTRLSDLDDDKEVKGAVITAADEINVRRQIWNELNREYLVQQLLKEGERAEKSAEPKPKRARTVEGRAKGQLDGPTAFAAVHEMATKLVSKKVNRDALERMLLNEHLAATATATDGGAGSSSAATAAATAAPAADELDGEYRAEAAGRHQYGLPDM
ncbi:hypothetical protein AMAG_15491 [Allomyces macrogynus ATCC 38327]|uniref:Cyclin-like domain-containing protein n=1 Tax=Allomyces macrogynus (strain ATCC 38327) TaxID=578462 RepID=A0A0L0T844_ALLM3|nr:hypothetical protein AMAG_15491 [Allomyces macrogynus ATCC 38327]|eukprot:KNE70739.1 hypothetical protein AMAG_15491 [Allomyces macrogynus ATCC 38327]